MNLTAVLMCISAQSSLLSYNLGVRPAEELGCVFDSEGRERCLNPAFFDKPELCDVYVRQTEAYLDHLGGKLVSDPPFDLDQQEGVEELMSFSAFQNRWLTMELRKDLSSDPAGCARVTRDEDSKGDIEGEALNLTRTELRLCNESLEALRVREADCLKAEEDLQHSLDTCSDERKRDSDAAEKTLEDLEDCRAATTTTEPEEDCSLCEESLEQARARTDNLTAELGRKTSNRVMSQVLLSLDICNDRSKKAEAETSEVRAELFDCGARLNATEELSASLSECLEANDSGLEDNATRFDGPEPLLASSTLLAQQTEALNTLDVLLRRERKATAEARTTGKLLAQALSRCERLRFDCELQCIPFATPEDAAAAELRNFDFPLTKVLDDNELSCRWTLEIPCLITMAALVLLAVLSVAHCLMSYNQALVLRHQGDVSFVLAREISIATAGRRTEDILKDASAEARRLEKGLAAAGDCLSRIRRRFCFAPLNDRAVKFSGYQAEEGGGLALTVQGGRIHPGGEGSDE